MNIAKLQTHNYGYTNNEIQNNDRAELDRINRIIIIIFTNV